MIFVQSARLARGPLKVTAMTPDPDKEGEMKPTEMEVDVVICNLSLGIGGDLEFAVEPRVNASPIFSASSGRDDLAGLARLDLSQMPKAPFGKRDGVPQQSR